MAKSQNDSATHKFETLLISKSRGFPDNNSGRRLRTPYEAYDQSISPLLKATVPHEIVSSPHGICFQNIIRLPIIQKFTVTVQNPRVFLRE